MAIIMILVPLAGCAGSDGEVNIDLTTEEIQELIDDNIDDFLNNTTLTVNQDIQNNSTVYNDNRVYYNNTTYVMMPSVKKVVSGSAAGVEAVDDFASVSLVVRSDRYSTGDSLNGANICVGIGTVMESDLQVWFSSGSGISFTSVPVADAAEATAKLIDGSCDAMAIHGAEAEEKADQLNSDGSADVWVLSPGGHDGPPSMVSNSITIQIHANHDEYISPPTRFVYVELHFTCIEGVSDCENFSIGITDSPDSFEGDMVHLSNDDIEVVSVCDNGITFRDTDYSGWRNQGLGFNCTHNWNYYADIPLYTVENWDWSSYSYNWSDWTYSFVYLSETMEVVA